MIKFYRNVEVEIIKDIDDKSVLISIPLHEYNSRYNDDIYEPSSPEFLLQIVDKKDITDNKIELFKEYEENKIKIMNEINIISQDLSKKRIELKDIHDIIESKRKIYNEVDILFKFLDNKINFSVVKEYNGYNICSVKEAITTKDSYYDHSRDIKLVTLFGDSKGNLQYKINQYRDGSGSGSDNVWFFETEDEAKRWLLNKIESDIIANERYFNLEEHIKMKEKYNIKSDIFDKKIEDLKKNKHKNEMKRIKELEDEIEKIKKEME
jgi:hypothetical protein